MKVTGWPVATILRGNVVMRDGELIGAARRPAGAVRRYPRARGNRGELSGAG